MQVTAVILAAGLGTRMKSRHAKVLHRAGGRTLIEQAVEKALAITTPDHVYVVVGHQAERVREAVAGRGVRFIHQAEQKGTGHALLVAADQLAHIPGLLVIYYGDHPLIPAALLQELVQHQTQSDAAGTMVTAVFEQTPAYGRVIRDSSGSVQAIVEQKVATEEQRAIREVNIGIYCWRADIFWKHLGEIQLNPEAREYYLTDMVEILIRAGYRIQPLAAADPEALAGINDRADLAAADRFLRDCETRRWMKEGVTIEKPETVTIDPGVRIGMDTVIEPFAQILGSTTIGESCRVGASSIVRDSELADDVEVGPFTIVNASRVGQGARVGPYSRLRFENEIEPGAQVGNFVELKKTRLGAGAKALHLAYLGDSSIGRGANIGAGTITCNYDGVKKHPTRVGDHAFVGSNSTLVAPVEIGEGAYLAAGSVITDAVPADALALGRARQINKEQWARKRRERMGK